MINWHCSIQEHELITKVVFRAVDIAAGQGFNLPAFSCTMDLTAFHLNGCPLDLDSLAKAKPCDLIHDVAGIREHINRETGKLEDCFLPRYAKSCPDVPLNDRNPKGKAFRPSMKKSAP